MIGLSEATDDELREEARRRGFDLHSQEFSKAAQQLLREIPQIRARLDELGARAKSLDSSR